MNEEGGRESVGTGGPEVTSVSAVFVDGAGYTRDMVIERELRDYRFHVRRHMSARYVQDECPVEKLEFPVATFSRIGRLPDERVVYGQVEAKLELWVLDIDVTYQAEKLALFDIAESNRDEWVRHLGRPVVCLFHSKRADDERQLTHHRFMGVGRQLNGQP